MKPHPRSSRRDFLKVSGGAAALLASAGSVPAVHVAGEEEIRVGVIGCGGRGAGAAENVLHAAKGVKVLAVGDYFEARAQGLAKHLAAFSDGDEKCKNLGNTGSKPEAFFGLDAYKRVIEFPGVNYIILATPPGFRPMHLEAAVNAGKHVFTEKPVAVDGAGIRTCLAAHDKAVANKLAIAAGTQRRHQTPYVETIKRIHAGEIGPLLAARGYWNQGDIWFRPRQPGMSDLDYQIHNWYHFGWLCGDHIVEQHVHQIDVVNWAAQANPLRCLATGGRTRPYRDPAVDGNIYNFFFVEYEYPSGMRFHSMCRQINGSDGNMPGVSGVSEALVGAKGEARLSDPAKEFKLAGKQLFTRNELRGHANPYVQEHTDLIASIRAGQPLAELKAVAESTLAAIMGRMSAYTGKVITWEQALNSTDVLMPADLGAGTVPVRPLATPGRSPSA